MNLDEDTALVCVVGANGTGKSHLLELIAACAHRLGLTPGVEIPRGDPFRDEHEISLRFHLAEGSSEVVDAAVGNHPHTAEWDRTITLDSQLLGGGHTINKYAGGVRDATAAQGLANIVVDALQNAKDVHFLSLDADRSYPKRDVDVRQWAEAVRTDWEGPEFTRGRSYRTTSTLYDEWLKYFLARENQVGTKLTQAHRRAKKSNQPAPTFEDPFEDYTKSLQKVLPHVEFSGVDPHHRTLLFDTTGLELNFNQLSGGEREIAFLVGQIDRFGLRRGLFLIDEPELHLNADLIRSWVSYLTGTVETGQIWLATHSLEAVEAAGQNATFVLERNEQTKTVDSLTRLDKKPLLSALSRAVGTPAFSIAQLLFVFVEGAEGIGERERFRKLADGGSHIRFIEGRSCTEVLRRLAELKALAAAAETGIRVAGIVDRDFRSAAEASKLEEATGVLVLPVHEAENLFLHPATIAILLEQNGKGDKEATDLIRDAADERAGNWIFQYAMAHAKSLPDIPIAAKERAKELTWGKIQGDTAAVMQHISEATGYAGENLQHFRKALEVAILAYSRKRTEAEFWKHCEGKQVLSSVAKMAGYKNAATHIGACFAVWNKDSARIPEELSVLRKYVAGL